MAFEHHIARRYLTQKKETGFITLISYISITGLTIGVASLIITLGILNGFERAIKDKIISFQSHIRVEAFHNNPIDKPEEIRSVLDSVEDIAAYAPFIEQPCILRYGTLEDGVVVRGIDAQKVLPVIDVARVVSSDSLRLGMNSDKIPGIILGIDLAERFEIQTGDMIVLASPAGLRKGIIGTPRRRLFQVRGYIDTGMSEYDNTFSFIALREAQDLFDMPGQISGFDIRLFDIALADTVRSRINTELGYPYLAQTWLDLNTTLFDWLRVQRLPILIAFGMIILVGAINLVSTLVLVVLEKQKDIGILKSLGATSRSIVKIFFLEGVVIGIVASAAGSLLALILGYIQNRYAVISLSKDVYSISTFTVDLNWQIFLQIGIISMILCLGATIYPAWKASRLLPSEAVRRE